MQSQFGFAWGIPLFIFFKQFNQPTEHFVEHTHDNGDGFKGKQVGKNKTEFRIHNFIVSHIVGFISSGIVFVNNKNSCTSVAAFAVGVETGTGIAAHLNAFFGNADKVVDMVVTEKCTDDVALFKPCFLLTGGEVLFFGTRCFIAIVVAGQRFIFFQFIPLVIVNTETGIVIVGGFFHKLIDFLAGDVLEYEGGDNRSAVGSFKCIAGLFVPFNLRGRNAAVTADLIVLVACVHHVDVESIACSVGFENGNGTGAGIASLFGDCAAGNTLINSHLFFDGNTPFHRFNIHVANPK